MENIICTNGAQHALLCALLTSIKSGDTILAEELTYPGLISLAINNGIKLIPARMDTNGLIPEELERICKQQNIKALFCTPTLQNPTTSIMPVANREKIASICRAHNILIIEDDAHGVLVRNRPPALQTFAPERTLLITSLSKAVSSGLRVGYLLAPKALVSRISHTVRSTCWMATPLLPGWIQMDLFQKNLREYASSKISRLYSVHRLFKTPLPASCQLPTERRLHLFAELITF